MRNHDFVSDGFLALIAPCLVLLCSIARYRVWLACLWRFRATPMTDQHQTSA